MRTALSGGISPVRVHMNVSIPPHDGHTALDLRMRDGLWQAHFEEIPN